MSYEPHNNAALVQALKEAHYMMLGYAELSPDEQQDAIRDTMRFVASRAALLDYKNAQH